MRQEQERRQQAEKERDTAEKRRETAEKERDAAEKQRETAEKERDIAKQVTEELKADIAAGNFLSAGLCAVVIEGLAVAFEKLKGDAELIEEIQLKMLKLAQSKTVDLFKNKMIRQLFRGKSEKFCFQEAKAAVNALIPAERGVKKRSVQMADAVMIAGDAVKKIAESDASAVAQAAADAVSYQDPDIPEFERKKSTGRKAVNGLEAQPLTKEQEEKNSFVCCKENVSFSEGMIKESVLRTLRNTLLNAVTTITTRYQLGRCNKCGRIHVRYFDGDLPVTPASTMGQSVAVTAGVLNASGIPLNKIQQIMFAKEDKLGNETLGRSIHILCQETFKPLYLETIKALGRQHTLLADETTIKILQSQGKGICEPQEETRQTDYLAAIRSGYASDKPAVIFSHLGGRGKDGIHAELAKYQPQVWVTDGYAAYDSYCDAHNIRHQCCLTHWRRDLLDAVDIDSLCKSLRCESHEEGVGKAVKELKNDPDIYYLCCVIKAISKIYGYEKTVIRKPGQSRESYLADVLKNRQTHARVLMEKIDVIMEALAAKHADQRGGKYIAKTRNNLIGKAVVYYMNHRNNFKLFLEDPEIPLDSNGVEASIRAVAVLRKACDFKQSVEYTESLCILLSLVETAKLNGIDDPIEWLLSYAGAYYQHRASNTLTYAEGDVNLDAKLMEFAPDSGEGFTFTPWMPWDYKPKNPS